MVSILIDLNYDISTFLNKMHSLYNENLFFLRVSMVWKVYSSDTNIPKSFLKKLCFFKHFERKW